LRYCGRADEQVKIRGYRVELGEIEARLRECMGVRQAVALVREDTPGERRLVAYAATAPEDLVEVSGLREHLKRHLPEYMVPTAFVLLPDLPVNASGKLDRLALPVPDAGPQLRFGSELPGTLVEEMLAQIWAEVLRLDRVGMQDNFFELGGHSLLATQVMARMRERLGVELPLRVLFEDSVTVRTLAAQVEQAWREQQGLRLPDLVRRPAHMTSVPLSFMQERMWSQEKSDSPGGLANEALALRLEGRLDVGALEHGLAALVRRHESLRTRIETRADEGVQVIDPPGDFRLPVVDLTTLSSTQQSTATRRLVQEESTRPFDFSQALFRVSLLRLSLDDHVLVVTIHHIVTDVWSLMSVLPYELSVLYGAYVRGEPAPLPELEVQYADYALWQRQWLQGEILDKQLGYWQEQLAGLPEVLELPTDFPPPSNPTYRSARHTFVVPPACLDGLHALSRRERTTLYMVLLAALQLVLSKWSGQEDVAVGSPISARTNLKTEGVMGFFVNILVLRLDLSGDPSFAELLGRVREVALGAYANQDAPFETLLPQLRPRRNRSHQSLFRVMFGVQNLRFQDLDLPGLIVKSETIEYTSAGYDLMFTFIDSQGNLSARVDYATDLFAAQTIARLAETYVGVLEAVVKDSSQSISELAVFAT